MIFNKNICQLLGTYLGIFSLALCLPLAVALYYQFLAPESHPQPHSTAAFASSLLIAVGLSLLLRWLGRGANGQIDRRESILLVALIWLLSALMGSLPFRFSQTLSDPIDAYFEAMSGLTTTGSTLISAKIYNPETGAEIPLYLTHPHLPAKTYSAYGTIEPLRDPETGLVLHTGLEAVSKAILFWRSLLQWLGGMGIVVIFLTILPALGVGGKFLYQMETTGPFKDELSPRIQQTASKLWKLYLSFTLFEIILLLIADPTLPLFDAVCLSFSNISTGGFSIRSGSLESYSVAIQWIVILFMILGSINFTLYFHILRLKIYRIYVPDLFLFLGVLVLGSLAVSFCLLGDYSVGEALRQGVFQAVSAQTSTGFVNANYDLWPFAPQMFLLLLMFIGGMPGSTAGGLKTSRFYILYKIVIHRLESLYRPDSVRKLRIGAAEVDTQQALTVLGFFCIAALFTVLGTAAYILDGIDPETALGLTASFLNNTGLAFRAAGPTAPLTFLSPFDKILATLWMLFGRLEFYVLLLLFLPAYWKNR